MELWQATRLIRSKNAGPWQLTFDIMFTDKDAFARSLGTELAAAEFYARTYAVEVDEVGVFLCEEAAAIKVTIPRPHSAGALGDTDVFGGQFHSPLVTHEFPDATVGSSTAEVGGAKRDPIS